MQFIGIAGKTGSGKTTVARILSGILSQKGYNVKLFSASVSYCLVGGSDSMGVQSVFSYSDFDQRERADRMDNTFSITEWWKSLNYAIFDDVQTCEEVANCRRNGVVIYIQGGKHTEPDGLQKWSRFLDTDLFHGADYIIPKQPSLNRLTIAVKAMVAAGGYMKQE